MRKLILFSLSASLAFLTANCSSDRNNDAVQQEAQDFTNANYIKKQMIGKFQYWGHKSPSCNCWVYSGDIFNGYFEFSEDNSYKFKSITSNVIQSGSYSISPVVGNVNASLSLKYKENGKDYNRFIILKAYENNTVTIFESTFDERYTKQ